ncbi:MAG TPA: J domain-containing protein [Spirochaetota bacterium]|nr:J domain-containing protein [Spirochaetota bacterium]HOM37814.1 J domain-containing protein [Spirochaetota bacterium]HPQ49309.1 J domain-containing protein [Spirochaetota bacterium]
MTFFDIIQEIAKKYSRVIQDFLFKFIYDSEYEEKDDNYFKKLIEKIDNDITSLKKQIEEKQRLKKEIIDKMRQRENEKKFYEENFNFNSKGYYNYSSDKYTRNNYNKDIARYYAMLELEYGAGIEDVKKAYRNLMKKYHPDFFSSDPEKQKIAKDVAQGLTRAYEELIKYLKNKG